MESRTPSPGTTLLVSLLVALIDENPNNPRQNFDLIELQALGNSLLKGQKTPIRVFEKPGGRYGLIAGHRRLRAARMVGLDKLQAIIEPEPTSADQVIQDQVVEQAHHTDYTVVEQIEAIIAIMQARNCGLDAVLEDMDITPSTTAKIRSVANKLDKSLFALVLEKKLPFSSAYLISRVPDAAKQIELANLGLKRSALEPLIDNILGNTKKANKPEFLRGRNGKAELKGADKLAAAKELFEMLKRYIAGGGKLDPSVN